MVKLVMMDDEAANGQGQGSEHTMHTMDEAANLDKWFGFMHTMLGCVDNNNVEACSISLVPEQLRKSKAEAYMPQVVSVGPLHKGKRTDLLYMEEIKWRCMLHLLHRCEEDTDNLDRVLRSCGEAMLMLDEIVRASYINFDDVRFSRNDLAKIMVLDGCFLLELLICGSSDLNDKIKGPTNDPSPGVEVLQREKVLSDLVMLENQIPLVVLNTMSTKLFPEIFTEGDSIRLIHEHALSILGYCSPDFTNIYSRGQFKAFHFLQLVHSFIDKEKHEIGVTEDWKISIEGESISHRKLKLKRCATRLQAAGVTIKPPEAQNDTSSDVAAKTRFDLKVTFSEGELKIPQLHITETTEAKWRNIIAWELNRTTLEKQRGGKKEDRISCQFICYAWFFRSLICSVHDVKLLQERKVILVQEVESDKGKKKIMSNEDLMNLFRNITKGVPDAEVDMDSRFGQVIQKLNSYPTLDRSPATYRIVLDRITETGKILWHIFRCFLTRIRYKCRAAYRMLRRDHIPTGWKLIAVLVVAAGLALTATQTHYSIHNH